MWRIYVGGLFTGFYIGGWAVWFAAWTIVPESARAEVPAWVPLLMFPFLITGETLRIRGRKTLLTETARAREASAEVAEQKLWWQSMPLGLLLLVIGGAAGALVGWLWGSDGGWAVGGAFGALIGFALGLFLHGFWEGLSS
jgi:hypothetical protein